MADTCALRAYVHEDVWVQVPLPVPKRRIIMTAKWMNFTKEEIFQFARESKSNSAFLKKMGYSGTGGNTNIVIQKISTYYPDLDISHFTHQGWKKDCFDYNRFYLGNNIRSSNMIQALIQLKGRQCECCKLSLWNNEPITLEVHHLDGNHLNNALDNLQLLCPNCHSQTDNWRGKNRNKVEISEEQFVLALQNNKTIRQALISLGLTPAGGNYTRAYALKEKYHID